MEAFSTDKPKPKPIPDVYLLKSTIEAKIRQGYVTSRILLGGARFIDDASQKTSSFNDPAHFPFYYHLGTLFPATSLVEVGVGLGLRSSCFVQGCETINSVLGFQQANEDFYSIRLARGNIRDHCKGTINIHYGLITDRDFLYKFDGEWDVALISDEADYDKHRIYLDMLWERIRLGGLIAADFQTRHEPSRKAFEDFCRARNRDPVVVGTRYGVGIVQR